MSHATNDLLASLTGGSDLFPEELVAGNHTTLTTHQTTTTSKLMQSGLLGDVTSGDGLFDAVDAQQQEQQEEEEQEQQKQIQQQQQEVARRQQEEAARQQAELQQQQQQQQQHQHEMNQQMMESVSLGGGGGGGGGGESYPFVMTQQQHQQPAYPQQQRLVYATPPRMTQQGMPLQMSQQQQQPVTMPQPPQQPGMSTMGMPPQQQNYPMNSQPQQQQTANQLMSQSMMMPPSQPNTNISMMSQSMMMPPASSYHPHPNPNNMTVNHPPQQPHVMMNHPSSTTSTMNQNASYGPPHPPTSHLYGPPPLGNPMAGMHNIHPQQGIPPQMRSYPVPAAPTQYGAVTVDQPLLLTGKGSLFVKSTPFWSYQIATQVPPHVWVVRRRFRDVVALEDRLRQDCPGCILPPRPDKHATRAIEEASAQQSQEFAIQRANELQVYLQQLVQHPMASQSGTLRFFLSLQDELGTAWPEVSSNAITRLANAGVEAAVKTAEQWTPETDSEDNAELLALYSMESIRMGAVLQAVPKLEGALSLVQEHSELCGTAGMEMGRWLKPSDGNSEGLEIVAGALLRSGRRSKRLSLELSAACASYSQQYKLCRNERLAFSDRRAALQRRSKERKSMMSGYAGAYGYPAGQEADEIGRRLLSEVSRIAVDRRRDWSASLKIIAASFKEAAAERAAIWEATLTQFDQHYPGYVESYAHTQQQQQQYARQPEQTPQYTQLQASVYSASTPPQSQVMPSTVPQGISQSN